MIDRLQENGSGLPRVGQVWELGFTKLHGMMIFDISIRETGNEVEVWADTAIRTRCVMKFPMGLVFVACERPA